MDTFTMSASAHASFPVRDRTVSVEASARVTGDIHSRRVSLIEGARFKGRIDMDYSEGAEARPAVSRAATTGK